MVASERYCLDSDVLIQAKNGPYGFDIAPAFWRLLREELQANRVYSSIWVYKELQAQKDELSDWARRSKALGLAMQPSAAAQEIYKLIVEHVVDKFPQQHANDFISGADPWVIAQALDDGAVIVTQEVRAGKNSQHPKIPNIAKEFGAPYTNTYGLLRRLERSLDGFR